MSKLIVYGYVEGKDIKFIKFNDRSKLDEYVNSLPENSQLEITVSPVKDFRSLKLNRTYWMYLGMIGDYLGYTKNEMHDYFKAKFLCTFMEINGENTLTCPSTADLSTKEFCEYLEQIFHLCVEKFSLVLPDIEEIKAMK